MLLNLRKHCGLYEVNHGTVYSHLVMDGDTRWRSTAISKYRLTVPISFYEELESKEFGSFEKLLRKAFSNDSLNFYGRYSLGDSYLSASFLKKVDVQLFLMVIDSPFSLVDIYALRCAAFSAVLSGRFKQFQDFSLRDLEDVDPVVSGFVSAGRIASESKSKSGIGSFHWRWIDDQKG